MPKKLSQPHNKRECHQTGVIGAWYERALLLFIHTVFTLARVWQDTYPLRLRASRLGGEAPTRYPHERALRCSHKIISADRCIDEIN